MSFVESRPDDNIRQRSETQEQERKGESVKYLPHTTHGNSTDLHSEGKVTDPEDISERIYGVDNTDHSAGILDENIPSSFGSHIRPVRLLSTETEEGSRIVDE